MASPTVQGKTDAETVLGVRNPRTVAGLEYVAEVVGARLSTGTAHSRARQAVDAHRGHGYGTLALEEMEGERRMEGAMAMTTERVPGPDLTEHLQFCADVDFLESDWDQMVEDYPDCFIAVYHGDVVATGSILADVLAELDQLNVPRRLAAIEYAASNPKRMIL